MVMWSWRGRGTVPLVVTLLAAGACADSSRLVSSQDEASSGGDPEVQQPDMDARVDEAAGDGRADRHTSSTPVGQVGGAS